MCQQPQPSSKRSKATVEQKDLQLKKQVRFGAVQECYLKPLPEDMTKGELYYSGQELQDQKYNDIKAKQDAFENNDYSAANSATSTFRGLEHVLDKMGRRRHISHHVQTVLDVHKEQKEMGYTDPYEIYIVARSQSKSDRKAAKKMGIFDAQEAALVLDEEEDDADISLASTSVSSSSSYSLGRNGRRRGRRSSHKAVKVAVSGVFKMMGLKRTKTF